MFLDDPYLEITPKRYPDPRLPDFEMKSWWCEFAFREKQRKLNPPRPRRGLAKLPDWLQKVFRRSSSQAANDKSGSLEAAPISYPVLDIQRPYFGTGRTVDTTTMWDVDCLLDSNAKVVEQEKEGQDDWMNHFRELF